MDDEGKLKDGGDHELPILDLGEIIPEPMIDIGQVYNGLPQAIALPVFDNNLMATFRQMAEVQAKMVESVKPMMESFQKMMTVWRILPQQEVLSDLAVRSSDWAKHVNVAVAPVLEIRRDHESMVSASVKMLEPPLKNFGLTVLIDGRFEYRGVRLQSLYHTSKHGKLLVMFLESPEHYVSKETIRSKLGRLDPVKGTSNLVSELRRALGKDGIEIDVTCRWAEGYQLKSVRTR